MAENTLQHTQGHDQAAGGGSVSLNMAGNGSQPTGGLAQRDSSIAGVTSASSFQLPETLTEVHDVTVPVLDHEHDELVADLAASDDSLLDLDSSQLGSSFFKQPNFKLWAGVLSFSLVILVGAFFFLAQQTTLFQGTVAQILDDEPLLEEPILDLDANQQAGSQASGTTSTSGTEPTFADEPESGSEPTLEDLLAASTGTEPTATTEPTFTDEPESGSEPTFTEGTEPTFSNGPILADTDTDLTDQIDLTGNAPTSTQSPIVISDPSFANPGQIPTNAIVIADQTPTSSATTSPIVIPSLASNTQATVLQSGSVQGNTGPGMLMYFIAPILFSLYRRRRRYAT